MNKGDCPFGDDFQLDLSDMFVCVSGSGSAFDLPSPEMDRLP